MAFDILKAVLYPQIRFVLKYADTLPTSSSVRWYPLKYFLLYLVLHSKEAFVVLIVCCNSFYCFIDMTYCKLICNVLIEVCSDILKIDDNKTEVEAARTKLKSQNPWNKYMRNVKTKNFVLCEIALNLFLFLSSRKCQWFLTSISMFLMVLVPNRMLEGVCILCNVYLHIEECYDENLSFVGKTVYIFVVNCFCWKLHLRSLTGFWIYFCCHPQKKHGPENWNPGPDILELYDVLVQLWFAASKTQLDV